MFTWWSRRAAHGCVDLGPWKMSKFQALARRELELPQDENGSFISEGNLNSGINLAFCIYIFIYPEFSEFELDSLLSTCIWPERSKKCEGMERM